MSTAGRKAAWLRHDAQRKATRARKLKEHARYIVRKLAKRGDLVKTGSCSCCGQSPVSTVWHHPCYERARDVIELCKKCHRHHHPRGGLFGGGVR
jgi:hypothetical protein